VNEALTAPRPAAGGAAAGLLESAVIAFIDSASLVALTQNPHFSALYPAARRQ